MGKEDRVGYPNRQLPYPIETDGTEKQDEKTVRCSASSHPSGHGRPPPLWVSAEPATDQGKPSWGEPLRLDEPEMAVTPTGWTEAFFVGGDKSNGVRYRRPVKEGYRLYATFFRLEGSVEKFRYSSWFRPSDGGKNNGRVVTHKNVFPSKRCNRLEQGVDETYCVVVVEIRDEVDEMLVTWQFRTEKGGVKHSVGTWLLPFSRGRSHIHQVAVVDRIVDGDTFVLQSDDSVRLIGIDTPEKKDPGFTEATNRLEMLILDSQVVLEQDQTKNSFEGLLRYVWSDGFVNRQMVAEGYAVPTCDQHPPDLRYIDTIGGCDTQSVTKANEGHGDCDGYEYQVIATGECIQPRGKGDILNCSDVSGPVRVLGSDPSRLDGRDKDNKGCG